MIVALALVPENEVVKAFEQLAKWKRLHKKTDKILAYFENNYIGPLEKTTSS